LEVTLQRAQDNWCKYNLRIGRAGIRFQGFLLNIWSPLGRENVAGDRGDDDSLAMMLHYIYYSNFNESVVDNGLEDESIVVLQICNLIEIYWICRDKRLLKR